MLTQSVRAAIAARRTAARLADPDTPAALVPYLVRLLRVCLRRAGWTDLRLYRPE